MSNVETSSETLAAKFEKALERRHPFLFPAVFMIIGFLSFFLLFYLTLADILGSHAAYDPFTLLGYPFDESTYALAIAAFGFLMLLGTIVVYIVCLIPITLLLIAIGKGMAVLGLSQDILESGKKFGGIQLVMRSLLPGFFGIGIGQAAISPLLSLTNILPQPWPISFTLITTLFYGAIGMISGMVLFPATWFVDDAGVVIHGMLETPYRVPPRVDGVGNWIRSFFAGLTMFLYPIEMILTFIVEPLRYGSLPILDIGIAIFVIIIGLPVIMMSFSIPCVILTEKYSVPIVKRIRSVARKMGAKTITFQEAAEIDVNGEKEIP